MKSCLSLSARDLAGTTLNRVHLCIKSLYFQLSCLAGIQIERYICHFGVYCSACILSTRHLLVHCYDIFTELEFGCLSDDVTLKKMKIF